MTNLRRLLHNDDDGVEVSHGDVMAPECANGDPWLWKNLYQCVEGPQQFVGFVMGILAIAVWIAIHALLLRLRHEHFTSKKTWSSASVLLHTTAADCLGLIGAVIALQLSTQIFLACYLLLADIGFWLYLGFVKLYQNGGWCFQKCKNNSYNYEKDKNMNNLVFITPFVISFMYLTTWFDWKSQTMGGLHIRGGTGVPIMTHRTRILLHADHDEPDNDYMEELLPKVGYGLGLAAILFTWTSLIHQSQWVFQEKKVPKAYYVTNVLMIMSDVFYLVSVFTQSVEMDFLLHTLPWTMARIGTIGLNVGVLFQAHLNTTQRLAGHEIDKDVAMILRSQEHNDTDQEEDVAEDRPLLEVPKKNKYIRKMRRIARQMETRDIGQSSEDELFSDDDVAKTIPPSSDVELELDLTDAIREYRLTNEEVHDILAAEDRQELVLPGQHHNPAVLQIEHSDKDSNDENETVIYFNERTDTGTPPVSQDDSIINAEGFVNSLKNYHKTVYLDDSVASVGSTT